MNYVHWKQLGKQKAVCAATTTSTTNILIAIFYVYLGQSVPAGSFSSLIAVELETFFKFDAFSVTPPLA